MPIPLRKSIVIIDDETSYARLLTEMMSVHLDCRIDAFARPLDALAALPTLDVGVVVTDYSMPQLNGVEFIAQASVLLPNVPFILITGHTAGMINSEELAKIGSLKCVMLKPFGWRKLAEEIIRLWPEPGANRLRGESRQVASLHF
ncbi:MAG: rpfG 2 [Verrucomicrobia bacterium]|nr:rpfG 2 [Verrucomicrobiota bacterium]